MYYLLTIVVLCVYIYEPSLVSYSHNPVISMSSSFLFISEPNTSILLNPGWTLKPEIIFYVTFFCGALVIKNNRYLMVSIMFVCLSLSFFSLFFESIFLQDYARYLYMFAIGIAIFMLSKKYNFNKITHKKILLFLSIGITCVIFYSHAFEFIYTLSLAGVFILLLSCEDCINHNQPIMVLIRKIGDSSYSLYLTHVFCIGVTTFILGKGLIYRNLYGIITTLVSIIIGYTFFRYVETPITNYIRRTTS